MTRNERGTITVFVVVFMFALLVVAGLVIDGGHTLAARREAMNVAESAARAGAQEVDEASIRGDEGIRLDLNAAQQRAYAYLSASGYSGVVNVEGISVTVEVSITRPLFILGVAGLTSTTVTGRGEARAVRGVVEENER